MEHLYVLTKPTIKTLISGDNFYEEAGLLCEVTIVG